MFYRYTNCKSGALTENGGPFYQGFDMRTMQMFDINFRVFFKIFFYNYLCQKTDEIKVCGVKYMQYFGAYKR